MDKKSIQELYIKLELLTKKSDDLRKELDSLKNDLKIINNSLSETDIDKDGTIEEMKDISLKEVDILTSPKIDEVSKADDLLPKKEKKAKSNIEKFIGENLINKIGILITIIGVGIGTKYAIDNQLINPITRIILGYLVGLGLLGFSVKLKKNYENFSAVLLSGSMAIMYFITFFAFDFYNLIPHLIAFTLMLLFTAFTVFAALNYKNQVIAIIGLVGAYAIPFLLSENSGQVQILFGYMTIINIGILILAFKNYWRILFISAFIISWLIFNSWFVFDYILSKHFIIAIVFSMIFFMIFYSMIISNKLIRKEKFSGNDILLILFNSFIYYGIGYTVINDYPKGENYLGLFALFNALLHFMVSILIFKQKLADKNLLYFILGLVITFITIAIPVQLEGNWVTLLWIIESLFLFVISNSQKIIVFRRIAFALILLSIISLLHDYADYLELNIRTNYSHLSPFINVIFMTSIVFIIAFFIMNHINRKNPYQPEGSSLDQALSLIFRFVVPASLIFIIFYSVSIEIHLYWQEKYLSSAKEIMTESENRFITYYNRDYLLAGPITILGYYIIFLTFLNFINYKYIKSNLLAIFNVIMNVFAIILFLLMGLFLLSVLRDNFLYSDNYQIYQSSNINILVRYLFIIKFIIFLITSRKLISADFIKFNFKVPIEIMIYSSIVWIASSELINILALLKTAEKYNYWLSILWGLSAMFIIGTGIYQKKKYLRISAIILFSFTLLKLFLYDAAGLDTISKTILFVLLGIFLLIISFLYNKYKNLIYEE